MVVLCGCYHTVASANYTKNHYLPQTNVAAHTVILSTVSSTTLTQTFVNPSKEASISECKYVFPLYDGVSVVGFKCELEGRVIKGVIEKKSEAKQIYVDAVEGGQTASLLEQGPTSDIFMTSLGNIAAGATLIVKITYIGELKHDMGINGIRYTLPTMISPRYGRDQASGDLSSDSVGGIAINVDISMPLDCPIQEIRSPSHPIALTLGRTSTAHGENPSPSQASVTLSLGTVALDKDFIIEILHKDSGEARALLETHADLPGQRALMVTLVPKMAPTKGPKPEIIIVADQSGSMSGARTETLVAALKILLKSLPIGVKFNICAFGSRRSLCFRASQDYSQSALGEANDFINDFDAGLGGTETLAAVKAAIESRDLGRNVSIILATDGDITQEQTLFDHLNEQVAKSKTSIRVFPLGIGNSASSALIEGVARAGNGFAQSVIDGEKQDSKIIKMLKGALTPDSGAYTLDVQYDKIDNDDEYELVERVTDSLRVIMVDDHAMIDGPVSDDLTESAMIVSDKYIDNMPGSFINTDRQRYIPFIQPPKLLQTPQSVPPLYPSSRTTVYILLSHLASSATPKSVVLRNDSEVNPFEATIPVEVLPQTGTMIHSLAAKRAILELEEGRGWLTHAKDSDGRLIKDTRCSCFAEIVEAEAVRLGKQYQIAGKWTSFVAVETQDSDPSVSKIVEQSPMRAPPSPTQRSRFAGLFPGQFSRKTARSSIGGQAPRKQLASKAAPSFSFEARGCVASPAAARTGGTGRGLRKGTGGAMRHRRIAVEESEDEPQPSEETDPLQRLVGLQTFEGFWVFNEKLAKAVGVSSGHNTPEGLDLKIWGTILAVSFLQLKMQDEKEAWEMVGDKAQDCLSEQGVEYGHGMGEDAETWWKEAKSLIIDA